MIKIFNNIFYKKYLIVSFFLFVFLIPQNIFAQCNNEGVTVVYVNGIFTPTEAAAKKDMYDLQTEYKNEFGINNINFITGYNQSHLAGLGDLIESASQLLNSPISDYDFKTILTQIHSEIKTQKIILVGYSQGSFYTNEIYNYLVNNGIPKESIAVYNIATPANYVAGSGEYLTSYNDKVINQARNIASKIKAPQPLPGNINIPLSEIEKKDSLGGHLFGKSYLKNAFSDITSGIQKKIKNLNSINEIPEINSGCFNLPDQNFIYKTQGVLFAVADPISNGTTFVAKTGYDGAVYMKNSTVDGIVVTASAIDFARKALVKDVVFIADLTTKAAIATGKTISNVAIVAADFTATTIVSNGKTMTDVVVLATQKIVNQTTKLVANTNEKMVSQITDKSQEKNQEMQKNLMFGSSTSITSKQTTLGKVEPQEIKKPQEKEMQEKEMSQEMPKQENQLMTNQTQNLNDKKENEIKKQENQLMTNDKFPMTNQTQNPNDKKENEIKKQKVLKPKFLEPKALALNLAPIINSTPVLASDSKPKFIESKIPMPISKPIPTPILKPIPTSISKPILTPILESKPDSNLIPTQNLITKNEPQYPLTPHAPSFFSTPSTSSYSYFSAPTIVESNTSLPKILISEICAGLKNSETKYIELYNPNDEEIILNDNNFQLKFFDSENQTTIKNIQWIKNKISPKGYFLLGTTSTLDDLSVDATYLDSSENISGVVISDGQNNIKDQLSWAKTSPSENVEANFFITKEDFKINQSIERKLIDAKNDATDFSLISILTPINSLNEKKVYDFQAPETILEKSPDTTTNLTTAFFSFSSDEQNVAFQYSLDDQEWEYSISIKEFSQLKLGNHILTVRAIDQSGNVDASPIIFQWKIIKKVLPLLITKIQIANEKNANDEYIELFNPNDEAIDLSDYSIQKKSGDEMNAKKIIGNIPANSHYLIVNSQADEILYYLADLKYDNFSLTENDAIYLVKDKKETTDDPNDFDIIAAIEFNDNLEKKENQVDNIQKGQVLKRKQSVDSLEYLNTDSSEDFEIINNSNPTNSKNENGPTYLDGEMTADTILSIENNPYIIENNFTVPEGKILTINPGVIIWPKNNDPFNPVNLTAKGTIIINGTKEAPVKFTSLKKIPQRADYGQALSIEATSKNSILNNVIFEYGDLFMIFIIPMVSIQGTDVKISNAIFREAEDMALSLIDSNVLIENTLFENNMLTALSVDGSRVEIKNCQFKNNSLGIEINNHSKTVFENNIFTYNQMPLFADLTNEINFDKSNQLLNNKSNEILFSTESSANTPTSPPTPF